MLNGMYESSLVVALLPFHIVQFSRDTVVMVCIGKTNMLFL